VSLTRLRWRLRGAWLWPAFAAGTLGAGIFLHARPLTGLRTGLVPALLLAGFLNLGAVALAATVGAVLLRRARPDLPRVVAADYAGAAAVGVVTVALVAGGLAHHGAVARERRDTTRALTFMRLQVMRSGPPAARRNIDAADTIRVDAGKVYRSCVPVADPARPYCVIVHLDARPPRVVEDGHEPNGSWMARGG
jgi:hypothetical protein